MDVISNTLSCPLTLEKNTLLGKPQVETSPNMLNPCTFGLLPQSVQLLQYYASQNSAANNLFDNTLKQATVYPSSVLGNILNEQSTRILENQTAVLLASLQNQYLLNTYNQSFNTGTNSSQESNKPLTSRKRKQPAGSFKESASGNLSGRDLDKRTAQLVAYLEKVERPRTWSQEETYCLVLVVAQNEMLVKQARYKELHLEFLAHLNNVFSQETKKTRQAFWARHCRIREKLGAEEYEQLFWKGKSIPETQITSKKVKTVN